MADEKKIIIDEDWKAQVQAEKEEAAKAKPTTTADESPRPAEAHRGEEHGPMPPASLELLVTMLATEAMVALGQIPHPATGQAQADRGQAQYLIDLIGVLREKTKGNLTPREEQVVEALLHELRMAFVQTEGAAER
jgi:hypothetical protein